MATTLSLLVYVQDQMLISNIGDTKVFLIQKWSYFLSFSNPYLGVSRI